MNFFICVFIGAFCPAFKAIPHNSKCQMCIRDRTSLDTLLDEHFDDSYMQRVYPKLVHMN